MRALLSGIGDVAEFDIDKRESSCTSHMSDLCGQGLEESASDFGIHKLLLHSGKCACVANVVEFDADKSESSCTSRSNNLCEQRHHGRCHQELAFRGLLVA